MKAGRMKVASLSGNMNKEQRQTILSKFKKGEFRALVVSGVPAFHCLLQRISALKRAVRQV